ncbi:hypothetical protein L198_06899 [Cryptococcus wingfieldii CBS 7118]|uniref:Uncharacterized protein n=1 Tax=Cryptococcus wingfieldii CBS 7118 TaxID=1295528 RepID=A0A1E3IIC5_9TREE|nr:hypothetical protein L198_06899 [Cryptococcus wingfieldii CBS 7118]ODN87676.1 hypothetical protein L198_06899 [Cryptococcus wingfieldii CBS 7118]
MSNTNKDPMILSDEEVDQCNFIFYDPSTNDYTSLPTDIPHFLSASRQVYADNMDTDLVWPEDQENVALAEPSADKMEKARPPVDSWRTHVDEVITGLEESAKLTAWSRQQLSFLQTRPSSGPRWIRKAATINRRVIAGFEQSRPDVVLSDVEKVTCSFWNRRSYIASWTLNRTRPGSNVSPIVLQDATAATADRDDSRAEMHLAGVPPITVPAQMADTRAIRSLITSVDLNEGALEDIQGHQGNSEAISERQMYEVRVASNRIRQLYDEETWGEKGPEFQELLGTWNESVRALQEAGVTELPDPPE